MRLEDDPKIKENAEKFGQILEDQFKIYGSSNFENKIKLFIFSHPEIMDIGFNNIKRMNGDLPDLIFGLDIDRKYTSKMVNSLWNVGLDLNHKVANASVDYIEKYGAITESEISIFFKGVFSNVFKTEFYEDVLNSGMFNFSPKSNERYSVRRHLRKLDYQSLPIFEAKKIISLNYKFINIGTNNFYFNPKDIDSANNYLKNFFFKNEEEFYKSKVQVKSRMIN